MLASSVALVPTTANLCKLHLVAQHRRDYLRQVPQTLLEDDLQWLQRRSCSVIAPVAATRASRAIGCSPDTGTARWTGRRWRSKPWPIHNYRASAGWDGASGLGTAGGALLALASSFSPGDLDAPGAGAPRAAAVVVVARAQPAGPRR